MNNYFTSAATAPAAPAVAAPHRPTNPSTAGAPTTVKPAQTRHKSGMCLRWRVYCILHFLVFAWNVMRMSFAEPANPRESIQPWSRAVFAHHYAAGHDRHSKLVAGTDPGADAPEQRTHSSAELARRVAAACFPPPAADSAAEESGSAAE